MTADTSDRPPSRTPRGLILRRLRIGSGLILFTFAATHLLNHGFGLVSIDAMDAVRDVRTAITRSVLGTFILLLAALVHMILGITKFLRRRTWRMSLVEAVQLAFGLLIPLLLFRHIIGTRIAHEMFGVADDYTYALHVMWPLEAWNQMFLITLVWIHGVIGVHMWLRMSAWYRSCQPLLYGVAVLIPVLGFAGFAVGGREVRDLREFANPYTQEQFVMLKATMDYALWGYAALLAVLVGFRVLRGLYSRFRPKVRIEYSGGPTVSVEPGQTLLEVSRSFDIPHASVCGGRARCSTCRVRILDGQAWQPEPSDLEARVLERVGATANIRLACQLRPAADLTVVTLLPAQKIGAEHVARLDKYFWGVEQRITLLFADIRGFTQISENRLPYDVVFLLNQYLGRMSEAITDAGGYIDKFMGDGIMAIFGMERGPERGAVEALNAARAMGGVLEALNQSLHKELGEPLRIGIGVHTGDAILGRIGVASTSGAGERVTALGDTVNTASRLESSCKRLGVQLIASVDTMDAAGYEIPKEHSREITVRGRTQKLQVIALKRALSLEHVEADAREAGTAETA